MKEKKKKDPKKKKRALIITGSILGVFALFVITVVMITIIGDKANIKRAESYDPVVIENQLVPEKDENGYWTFTTDRDLKIMQLTDIHLGGGWLSLKKDSQAINAVATMIQAEKPDLVIITGDMAFPVFFKAATFNNTAAILPPHRTNAAARPLWICSPAWTAVCIPSAVWIKTAKACCC